MTLGEVCVGQGLGDGHEMNILIAGCQNILLGFIFELSIGESGKGVAKIWLGLCLGCGVNWERKLW